MGFLDLPYVNSILMELLSKDGIPMTFLQKIATSYPTVVKVIDSLEAVDLVRTEEKVVGRKTRFVFLTEKGRLVAQYLHGIENISVETEFLPISRGLAQEIREILKADTTWNDEAEFLADAAKAFIEKWKKGRSAYGNPRRYIDE